MKKILIGVVSIVVFLLVAFYVLNSYIYNEKQAPVTSDYKNASYRIDGKEVQLTDGVSEIEAAPGSATKITTRYFGNDYLIDLNNDGERDVVFLITQETGGSGVFYYAVAALKTEGGYVGSDGYLLGDRIAPQTIGVSDKPQHKEVVRITYAERAANEPMTTQPSVGKNVYLKLDTTSMMWGTVEADFEGESR